MAEAKTVGSLHSDSTEVGFNSALGACQVAHLWEEALGSSAGTEEAYESKDEKVLERILETYSTWLFQVISFDFSEYLWTGWRAIPLEKFFCEKKTSWISCRFSRGQQVSYLEDFGNIT